MGDKDPHNSKKKPVILQQTHLFDDLIIQEILTRLPVKSILRFKSVSKHWYSTLSSSNFVISHFMKSSFSHPSAPINTLFIQSLSNFYLFYYNDDQICGNFEENLVKLDPSELWVQKGKLQLTGCCNGLICLTSLFGDYFILWNPATRKMQKYETHWYIKHSPFVSGFGYASSVDDYKYVQLSMTGLGFENDHNIVHIFSLREKSWTRLDFDHTALIYDNPPVLINEILHWPALCHQSGDSGHSMISFDLGVERFDIVNLDPMECLGVMGGCLSRCSSSYVNTGEMLMHIFESESPGGIVKSIGVPEGLTIGKASQMVGFTRTGKFFVTGPLNDETETWDSECRRLGIVDTATKPMQYTTLFKLDENLEMINIARYVPSLVSPFPVEELSRA